MNKYCYGKHNPDKYDCTNCVSEKLCIRDIIFKPGDCLTEAASISEKTWENIKDKLRKGQSIE